MRTKWPQKKWKRSTDIVPFPTVWHTFQAEDKYGKTRNIRIQDMTPDQREEVWDMYQKHFYPDEYVWNQLNFINDRESMTSEKLLSDYVMDQNLTIIAVLDEDEGTKPCIVGGLKLMVIHKKDPPLPELPVEATAKLNNILDTLQGGIDIFEELNSNCLLKECDLVVKKEFRRMNIGSELFKTMERIGKVFHIPAAVVILADYSTQILARKLGFILLKEVKLNECEDAEGQNIVPESDAATIAELIKHSSIQHQNFALHFAMVRDNGKQ